MATQIFVNLPVKNLEKTVEFFTALGFKFDQQFTDENATCMIIGENIFAMLLVEKFFKTFIRTEISDAHKVTEVINALSLDSREAVDDLVEKAVAAGGTSSDGQDHGWMYQRGFRDLDGHHWEVMYTDMDALGKQMEQSQQK